MNSSLYIVLSGLLHVRRHAQGRKVLLGRMGSGSFFGDVSIFDPGPTSAAVVAVEPGRLLEITGDHLRRFTEQRPSAAAALLSGLLELMAKRLRRTDDRLVDAIFWEGMMREPAESAAPRSPAKRN